MKKATDKAKELMDKFAPYTIYWDCYNDEPIEENYDRDCALICAREAKKTSIDKEYWDEVIEQLKKI